MFLQCLFVLYLMTVKMSECGPLIEERNFGLECKLFAVTISLLDRRAEKIPDLSRIFLKQIQHATSLCLAWILEHFADPTQKSLQDGLSDLGVIPKNCTWDFAIILLCVCQEYVTS